MQTSIMEHVRMFLGHWKLFFFRNYAVVCMYLALVLPSLRLDAMTVSGASITLFTIVAAWPRDCRKRENQINWPGSEIIRKLFQTMTLFAPGNYILSNYNLQAFQSPSQLLTSEFIEAALLATPCRILAVRRISSEVKGSTLAPEAESFS